LLSCLQRLVAFKEAQPTKDLISDAIQQQVRVLVGNFVHSLDMFDTGSLTQWQAMPGSTWQQHLSGCQYKGPN
jgi:hypothetical protein